MLLKALDRDPRQRYATAGELGRDIDNFLRGEPVSARPATIVYFLGKRLARHRLAVAAALGCTLALATLAGYAYVRIAHLRDVAEAARKDAEIARDGAETARARAAHERRRADSINEFVQYVMDALDPKNSHGRGVNREMMDRADRMLSTRFAGEPQEEAAIRATLGRNMLALGQFATAEGELRRVIELMTTAPGALAPQALAAMQQLAEVYRERGKIAEACELSQKVVELCKDRYGIAAPQTLDAMNTLAAALNEQRRSDQAEEVCRKALFWLVKSRELRTSSLPIRIHWF